jgi:hypothetical protein
MIVIFISRIFKEAGLPIRVPDSKTLHLGQPAIDVLKAKERVKDILAFNSLIYLRLRLLVGGFSGRFRRLGVPLWPSRGRRDRGCHHHPARARSYAADDTLTRAAGLGARSR